MTEAATPRSGRQHAAATPEARRETSGPIVEARGVVKTYRRGETAVQALRGTDLVVDRGEMVAVVGRSGSGKTTMLNCLSGLDDIDEGTVLIEGRDIHAMSDRERTAFRGRSMGFIFQAFNLVSVFTAAENVELPLLLSDVSPDVARDRAESVLAQVGLSERVEHRPAELSGGEQQRVAIARALAPEPAIVWTDEPTGNLDSATGEQVMDLLDRLNDEGLSIVLVTHDETITKRADRLLTMSDGRIVGDESQP